MNPLLMYVDENGFIRSIKLEYVKEIKEAVNELVCTSIIVIEGGDDVPPIKSKSDADELISQYNKLVSL